MMKNIEKRKNLKYAKRIVVKVGSKVLVDKSGTPNVQRMKKIVKDISSINKQDNEIALVTSGAIGSGIEALKFKTRPTDITDLQMAAAVGQLRLISIYDELFKNYKCQIAQILLTHDVLKNKHQCTNAQNTISNLLSNKIIPIINENDTVSTDEIKFGDNDVLAGLVAKLINADALILLSTIDGLRTSVQNGRTKRISYVNQINKTIFSHVDDQKDNLSLGGMKSKLESAKLAGDEGIPVIIADGRKDNVVSKIISGEDEGTFFNAKKKIGNFYD